MSDDAKECNAFGWVIVVPTSFAEVNNEDSWQAHADTRVVYVSSLVVQGGNPAPSAHVLCATASKRLPPASDAERYRVEGVGLEGEAAISQHDSGFELKGFTCVDGRIATCVISFERALDRDWAIATWKSLRRAAAPDTRPWWRFW